MLPKDLTKDVKTRLQSIKGQLEGLIKMLDEEQDPEKILVQFKAANKGLEKAQDQLLNEAYRKSLALKIVETVDACPGNCGNEDHIELLRREFPIIGKENLTQKMKEIAEVKARIDKVNDDAR